MAVLAHALARLLPKPDWAVWSAPTSAASKLLTVARKYARAVSPKRLGAVGPDLLAFTQTADAVALVAWLHTDALIKRLDAEIDAESDDGAALSHADRELRTAEVMGDLLAVERDESALVWQAQSQNLPVEHRADCSPLAILQLRLITTPRETNGHATSPEHAYDIVRR